MQGCKLCEYYCVKQHYGNIINPEISRVRRYHVFPGPMAIPIQCSSCFDHPCVDACPVDPKVLYVDEKKFVLKPEKERRLGHKCGKFVETCNNLRSGSIHFYPPEHDYPIARALHSWITH